MTYCKGCLSKQQKINELEEEITSLKSKLRYQERTAKEGFFGSSTPSSRVPVKPNSPTGDKRNQGGAKPGHKGHGRSSIREQDADKVEKIHIGNTCPDCGSILEDKGTKTRAVIDCQPVKMKKVVYYLERKRCPRCKKIISARPPVIARKISFGSQSDAGAKTREILMTVLRTLKKTTVDVTSAFKSALDKLAEQGDIDIYKAVFKFDSS